MACERQTLASRLYSAATRSVDKTASGTAEKCGSATTCTVLERPCSDSARSIVSAMASNNARST